MNALEDKVALVTGSSRGIGAAIAKLFAREGAKVVVHGRDAGAMSATRAAIEAAGGRAITVAADVTRFAEIEAMTAAKAGVELLTQDVAAQAGPFDVRVNCIAPETILTEGNLRRIPETQRAQLADAQPLQRLGTPDDVARAALFLASDSATWITGVILDVAGGAVMVR